MFYRFTLVFLLVLSSINLFGQPINSDGGLEDATAGLKVDTEIPGWALYTGGAAQADFYIVEDLVYDGTKALKVEVQSVDANAWDIQAVNEPFVVLPNTAYTYSVWAMADVEGGLVNFTVGSPTYAEWGRTGVTVGLDWQNITFDFTTPAGVDTGRAPIHFAETANGAIVPISFYIDDLTITPKSTGVNSKNGLPHKFSLEQNYPNPFNPTTKIQFSVPENSDVQITVVDILGNVVKNLVSGYHNAGTYRVELNASDLAAGVYFYKMQAGNYTDVKKLLLIK